MFLLYNLALTLLAPLWAPWMFWRARRRKEAPNWRERMGEYGFERRKDGHRIWLHAVSVGEVMAALPILERLRVHVPDHEIVLSVTTSSGHRTATDRAAGLFDRLVYFPIDVPRFQLSAMQRVQPCVVAIMETELWFNFLWAARTFGAGTLLVNGRISDRSFPRAKFLRFFYSRLLSMVDRCLMQTQTDAERILALGARSAEVLGNSKFDGAAGEPATDIRALRESLIGDAENDDRIVVVGSTRSSEEEDFVIEALGETIADGVRVIHAPRHLERAAQLHQKAVAAFGQAALRSRGETGRYLVLDTYGELAAAYALADVAIVGGGFGHHGGQNIIQPLAHGKPVLFGPHMDNFRDAAASAVAAGAGKVCATPAELRRAVHDLLADDRQRTRMGAAGAELVRASAGASERYALAIKAACSAG